MSSIGTRMGRLSMRASVVSRGCWPASATSVDVPPISNVSAFLNPQRRAISTAPTIPPAGPGENRPHRVFARFGCTQQAAVRLHDRDLVRAFAFQFAEITIHQRTHVGVDHRRAGAFEFAELRRNVAGGTRRIRPAPSAALARAHRSDTNAAGRSQRIRRPIPQVFAASRRYRRGALDACHRTRRAHPRRSTAHAAPGASASAGIRL